MGIKTISSCFTFQCYTIRWYQNYQILPCTEGFPNKVQSRAGSVATVWDNVASYAPRFPSTGIVFAILSVDSEPDWDQLQATFNQAFKMFIRVMIEHFNFQLAFHSTNIYRAFYSRESIKWSSQNQTLVPSVLISWQCRSDRHSGLAWKWL